MAAPVADAKARDVPTTTAKEAADSLGALLSRVEFGREEIVITRHGKPVARLVPIEWTVTPD